MYLEEKTAIETGRHADKQETHRETGKAISRISTTNTTTEMTKSCK